jgi:hypothetical protein
MDENSSKSGKKSGRIGLGIGLAILSFVALPIWFFFIGPQMRHDRIAEKGIRAPGRLLMVEETNTTINDVPELELTVEFTRKDGTLDTAVTDFVPTRRTLHMYQDGIGVTAAYDPEDPDEITILEIGGPVRGVMNGAPATAAPNVDSLRHVADSLTAEMEKLRAR